MSTALTLFGQDVSQAANWTQQDFDRFVQEGGGENLRGELVLNRAFQQRVMEVGVFGGQEEFDKALCLFRSECDVFAFDPKTDLSKKYPMIRVITHFRTLRDKESIYFQTDEGSQISLVTEGSLGDKIRCWTIVEPFIDYYGNPLLITQPPIWAKIAAVARFPKVAKDVLANFLSNDETRLVLEFTGYPQNSRKTLNEVQETLYKLFFDRAGIGSAPFDVSDPLKSNSIKKTEHIASIIVSYAFPTTFIDGELNF